MVSHSSKIRIPYITGLMRSSFSYLNKHMSVVWNSCCEHFYIWICLLQHQWTNVTQSILCRGKFKFVEKKYCMYLTPLLAKHKPKIIWGISVHLNEHEVDLFALKSYFSAICWTLIYILLYIIMTTNFDSFYAKESNKTYDSKTSHNHAL